MGLGIVSFLFPIVGIILAISKWKTTPKAAKTYLICAIASWVVSFFLIVIGSVLGAGLGISEYYAVLPYFLK